MTEAVALSPKTTEVIKRVRKSVGLDEKRIAEANKHLRQWLERQPHLPHCIDDKCLENIFLRCKGSIERAKSSLDTYYSIRTAFPEFFTGRDIAAPWSCISKVMYFLPLPKLTDEGYRITISSLIDYDPEKYLITEILKLVFMTLDLLLLEDYSVGNIFVMDCKNIKMAHAACYTPLVIKKIVTVLMHGYSARVKALHITNAPQYIAPVVNIARSILKPKLAKRIFVHYEGCGNLGEYISPQILPFEFQGQAGSVLDMWDAWLKKLHEYRNWFIEDEKYKADESKRIEQLQNRESLFGSDGSFRQLNID